MGGVFRLLVDRIVMGAGSHVVSIVGRFVCAPLLRDGVKPRANFTIAVDRQNGVDWRCVAWGPTANAIAEHTDKGHLVAMEGRLPTGKYTNDTGDSVYTMDVAVALLPAPRAPSPPRHHRPRRPGQRRRVRGACA